MTENRGKALRARLAALKVVPVIRTPDTDLAIRACEWLLDAGMQALELTFTIPDADRVIQTFARTAPDALIGAGTVRTPEQAKVAIDSGAAFLVSPAAAPGCGRDRHGPNCLIFPAQRPQARSRPAGPPARLS